MSFFRRFLPAKANFRRFLMGAARVLPGATRVIPGAVTTGLRTRGDARDRFISSTTPLREKWHLENRPIEHTVVESARKYYIRNAKGRYICPYCCNFAPAGTLWLEENLPMVVKASAGRYWDEAWARLFPPLVNNIPRVFDSPEQLWNHVRTEHCSQDPGQFKAKCSNCRLKFPSDKHMSFHFCKLDPPGISAETMEAVAIQDRKDAKKALKLLVKRAGDAARKRKGKGDEDED